MCLVIMALMAHLNETRSNFTWGVVCAEWEYYFHNYTEYMILVLVYCGCSLLICDHMFSYLDFYCNCECTRTESTDFLQWVKVFFTKYQIFNDVLKTVTFNLSQIANICRIPIFYRDSYSKHVYYVCPKNDCS